MGAGKYRHRVDVQWPTRTSSASGATKERYLTRIQVWARIEALSPREFWAAQQIQSEISARITMRYRPGIHAKCRIMHRRRAGSPDLMDVYDIEGPPVVDPKKRELQLNVVRRDTIGFRAGYLQSGNFLLAEDGQPLLSESGQPLLNEDSQ